MDVDADLGLILASSYRKKTLIAIGDYDVLIPKQISQKTGILQNHLSNTLKELREHDLIECINPEVRKGRLYRLTQKGYRIYEFLSL